MVDLNQEQLDNDFLMINKHDGVDFSNKQFWIFDEKAQTVSKPNLIGNFFRGVPDYIDSAMYWEGEFMSFMICHRPFPESGSFN